MGVKFGLTDRDIQAIEGIFSKFPEVETVCIFGSRAKGSFKAGSDVDLAIMNKGLNNKTLLRLKNEFEESNLPYVIDLVNFHSLTNAEFIDHIKRMGIVFYQKQDVS